jgi:hypothetical protein
VLCGHLHGWYSSSKDQVLVMQQQSKNQPPPAAAPASAWVARSGKGQRGVRVLLAGCWGAGC